MEVTAVTLLAVRVSCPGRCLVPCLLRLQGAVGCRAASMRRQTGDRWTDRGWMNDGWTNGRARRGQAGDGHGGRAGAGWVGHQARHLGLQGAGPVCSGSGSATGGKRALLSGSPVARLWGSAQLGRRPATRRRSRVQGAPCLRPCLWGLPPGPPPSALPPPTLCGPSQAEGSPHLPRPPRPRLPTRGRFYRGLSVLG